MKKVIWAGCAFNDRYYIATKNGFKAETDEGGIFNCKISSAENLYDYVAWDEAKFIINRFETECRATFRQCQKFTEKDIMGNADWLHIAYIDALPNLRLRNLDLSRFSKISCDFCNNCPKPNSSLLLDNLSVCDFIFDNMPKDTSVIPWYFSLNKKNYYIFHDEAGSSLMGNQVYQKVHVGAKPYLFTVGAGDRFAARFIQSQLRGEDMFDSQHYAHREVNEWLQEVNEGL